MSKIRSLTPKQVIMAMVDGLKNPKTKISMSTFGYQENGVCYGCAATNALCQLFGIQNPVGWLPSLNDDKVQEPCSRTPGFRISASKLNEITEDIMDFENAVDYLRRGDLDAANFALAVLDIAPIRYNNELEAALPRLTDSYTLEDLEPYIRLAEFQDN